MWTSAWMSVWTVTSCASTPWGHMSVPVKKDTESAVMEEPVSVSSQGIFWVFHKFLPLPALQSAGEENFRTLSPSFRFLSLSLCSTLLFVSFPPSFFLSFSFRFIPSLLPDSILFLFLPLFFLSSLILFPLHSVYCNSTSCQQHLAADTMCL